MGNVSSLTSFFFTCPQNGCPKHYVIEYAEHNAIFWHLWNKGRDIIIKLILQEKISERPNIVTTAVLVEKLIKISKINSKDIDFNKLKGVL